MHAVVDRLCEHDPFTVRGEAERRALVLIGAAWNAGWQPSELARQIRRTTDATTANLALVAIAADHCTARGVVARPSMGGATGRARPPRGRARAIRWIVEWARAEDVPWPQQVDAAIALLASLGTIAPIAILIPPPGARAG